MRLSKKFGVNPTIPLCHYCHKPKRDIILTGFEGEKWAKKNGYPDGQMPMEVLVYGDITPCESCMKLGIAVAEVESDTDKTFTGRCWLIKDEAIKKLLAGKEILSRVLQKRVLVISRELAEHIGLGVEVR